MVSLDRGGGNGPPLNSAAAGTEVVRAAEADDTLSGPVRRRAYWADYDGRPVYPGADLGRLLVDRLPPARRAGEVRG